MATLSANSRRNSAAAAALSNADQATPLSPQVAPPALLAATPSPPARMQAVSEEEDADNYDASGSPLSITPHKTAELELRLAKNNKSSACSERSDSGFSETCSSCTGGSTGVAAQRSDTVAPPATAANQSAQCACSNAAVGVGESTPLPSPTDDISPDVVIQRVETPSQNGSHSNSPEPADNMSDTEHQLASKTTTTALTDPTIDEPSPPSIPASSAATRRKSSLSRSLSSASAGLHEPVALTAPIMKSDFTNTIRMRKQSLEMHSNREAHQQQSSTAVNPDSHSDAGRTAPKLDMSGKVSKLMLRYTNTNAGAGETPAGHTAQSPTIRPKSPPAFLTSTTNKTPTTPLKLTHKSMDFRNVRDRFNNIHTNHTTHAGQPSNGSGARRQTPLPPPASLANNTNLIISKLQSHSTQSTTQLAPLADRDPVDGQPGRAATAQSAFERTPIRVSGRIRETRERLCRAAQDSSAAAATQRRPDASTDSAADGSTRSTGLINGSGQFARAAAFWKS